MMPLARRLLILSCAAALSLYLIACSDNQHPSTPIVGTESPQPAEPLSSWADFAGMSDAEFERILSEIPPVYDPDWEQKLIRASTARPNRHAPEGRNVEALTVLRRLQQLPDPLQITIEGNERRECVYPELPSLDVGYANRDAERLPLFVEQANLQNRGWFVQVEDLSGRQPTFRKGRIPRNGASEVIFTTLKFGSKQFTQIDFKKFLEIPLDPGQYQIRVLLHASGGLSERNLDHHILCVSEPILLTVKSASSAAR